MDYERLHAYLTGKPGAAVDFPFDPVTLVLKVGGRMFAFLILDEIPMRMNLKCDPDYALELRERYPEVQPGWHMNKVHWNTVSFEGALDEQLLRSLIDESYKQVAKTLKKADREALEKL